MIICFFSLSSRCSICSVTARNSQSGYVALYYEHDDHLFLQPQQSLLDLFVCHSAKFTAWLCCIVLRAWWSSVPSASAVVIRFFLRPQREIHNDQSSRGLSRLLCIRREYAVSLSNILGQLNDCQLLRRGCVSGSPWNIDVPIKNDRSLQIIVSHTGVSCASCFVRVQYGVCLSPDMTPWRDTYKHCSFRTSKNR